MKSLGTARRRFLPEVQALRALAVLLVVAYHLEPRLVPGGFVGVDVFFVISGFLISGHLLREWRSGGRISLSAFWAARVRRILPVALLVIIVVLAAALLLMPNTQWQEIGVAALASAFSLENWLLAANSVDYLAAEANPTALQHYWSLGVEEQFYIFWPLLMLGVLTFGSKVGTRGNFPVGRRHTSRIFPRKALIISISLLILLSLAYATFLVGEGTPAVYFVTQARVWELAAGGLLAVCMAPSESGNLAIKNLWLAAEHARSLFALGGLVAIGIASFAYGPQTPFPGIAAILPVLGTMLVILAGETSGPLSLRWLSDQKIVQWVGNISFSLYLWHWPVLIFFLSLHHSEPGPVQSIGLLLLSVLLAAASYYLVESPARGFKPLARSNWKALGAGALAVSIVAGLTLVPGNIAQRQLDIQERTAAALVAQPPAGFGAAAVPLGAPRFINGEGQIVPVPALAAQDLPALGDCVQKPQSERTKECTFGDPQGSLTIALVGDSHAAHWFKALEESAKTHGWKIVTYLKNSCPFTAAKREAEKSGSISCSEANRQTMTNILQRGDIDAVVTAYWSGSTFEKDPEIGFSQYWKTLEDAGIRVYPIVDTPRPATTEYARDCVVTRAEHLAECDTPQAKGFESNDYVSAAAALEPRVDVLNFNDQFCVVGTCPAVIGNVLVYRDKHHISDTYMHTLAPVFADRLMSVLGKDGLVIGANR